MITTSSIKSTMLRRNIRQPSQGEYNLTQLLQGEGKVYHDKEKRSLFSKKSKVRGWEALKGHSVAKNISEKNSERVGSLNYFLRVPSIPSICNLSAPFGNLSPISERVNS